MSAFRAIRRTVESEAIARGYARNFRDAAAHAAARGDSRQAERFRAIARQHEENAAAARRSVVQVAEYDRVRTLARGGRP